MTTKDGVTVNYPRGSGRSAAPPAEPADFDLSPPPDTGEIRKRGRREQAEQIAFMDRVRCCPRPESALVFALANENAAGKGIGVLRRKMGVRAGLPDIGAFVPRIVQVSEVGHVRHCSGLFIELKCSDGVASDVSAAQRAVHDALEAQGYKVAVCYGARRAWSVLCEYLGWEDAK